MATEYERKVLEFYQLQTAYPTIWPADKNENHSSDEEGQKKKRLVRRKSRYQALERAVSKRQSFIPGSEQSDKGTGPNLVLKDEPDPLGTTDSVVRTLRTMGLPIKDDTRLRNRFLLSSTTFQPATFLSQVHATADTDSLLQGLDHLSRSIDQKSASLKVLVETNFERFVRAKATIDNVYREMKYRGAEPPAAAAAAPGGRARAHSRRASRSSFRGSISGSLPVATGPGQQIGQTTTPPLPPTADNRKKNALVKESEYGVVGIKVPLLDVSAKAEDVWGPALGGREKEEHLKTVAAQMEKYKEYVELSAAVAESTKRKDYESLVEEYTRARKFADATRKLVRDMGRLIPTDPQLYQILLAGRVWHDVDEQIQSFKRDIWRRLISVHNVSKTENGARHAQDQAMELINLLLELGVDESPIWIWLISRYDFLKGRIQATADRAKVEIEILRRRLANGEKQSPQTLALYLKSAGRQALDSRRAAMDAPDVVELWEKIMTFLNSLLSSQGGFLGEVVEFWHTVQEFIDGKTQRSLPVGYNGESRRHHQISQEGVSKLATGTVELVEMIRDHVFNFFRAPPPEDISLLFSPLPLSPVVAPSSPRDSPVSPRDPRFNLDANTVPPSPRTGESWEKYAFWPPWSNTVSGIHYLAKMLTLVGIGAAESASIAPVARAEGQLLDRLRSLVSGCRERCVSALLGAWNRDAENFKFVEDWRRAPGITDVTCMPNSFSAFDTAILVGMQKILYVSEAMSKPGAENIVLPPQSKLLQMVRNQYVSTLYKVLSGIVENAEHSVEKADDDWTTDVEGSVVATAVANQAGRVSLDPSDRSVRMLLSLGNVQALRMAVVPALNSQFENAFSVKLTDESKTIKDVLGQIDSKLFFSYAHGNVEKLGAVVYAGITAEDWAPAPGARPTGARPYVYEALLNLVLVHSQLSTTVPSLTYQLLSFFFERLTEKLLDAFRQRQLYPLEALMQATLDVEFAAQTLAYYTSTRTSELQSQIYADLDGRTDDDARTRLQGELPEMRNLLKKLREASRNEFACFRKPRKSAQPTNSQTY